MQRLTHCDFFCSNRQGLLGDSKSVLPTSLPSMESIKISFDLPTIDMPDIKVPSLNLKSIELPSIDLPSMQLPSIDLPSIDFANPDLALPVIGLGLAAVAVAVLAAGGGEGRGGSTDTAATAKKSNNKASQLYAIPYDAAARLAYDSWRREHGDAPFNEEGYVHFQEIYIAKAVADATSKKLARDLEISFANKARPPAPPRQIAIPPTTPKTENATEKQPFFFAQLE